MVFDPGTGWHLNSGYGSPFVDNWPAGLSSTVLRSGHIYKVELTADGRGVDVLGDDDLRVPAEADV